MTGTHPGPHLDGCGCNSHACSPINNMGNHLYINEFQFVDAATGSVVTVAGQVVTPPAGATTCYGADATGAINTYSPFPTGVYPMFCVTTDASGAVTDFDDFSISGHTLGAGGGATSGSVMGVNATGQQTHTSGGVVTVIDAATNYYDNSTSGVAATNVQDALDILSECACPPAVTQTAHGYPVGSVVASHLDQGTGLWELSDSSVEQKIGTHILYIIDANTFQVYSDGRITLPSPHGLGSVGEELWVSDSTPGLLQNTAITTPGSHNNLLAEVIDANTIEVRQWRPFEIPAASSGPTGVTQAGHGFVVGDVLLRSAGSYVKADASAINLPGVVIVSNVIDANAFELMDTGGVFPSNLGFTDGDFVWLSDSTAGTLTSTAPTTSGNVDQIIGQVTATGINLLFWRPYLIP